MRRVLLFTIVALAVLPLFGRLGREAAAPDGAVRVVTGAPVRVVLPVDASVAVIEQRTREAVAAAAEAERGTEMRAELNALAGDEATIAAIAESGGATLAAGRAVALAFPWFRVDASGDRVVIYSVTVELIPGSRSIAHSKDHEDGHAEVNDQLALRCGPSMADDYVADGLRGVALERTMTASLLAIADEAHEVYHGLVRDAPLGSHLAFARRAAAEVAEDRCG